MSLEKTLSKDYYFTPAIFAEEREKIFFRQWVCVGRTSELSEPGRYVAIDMSGESIVIVRDDQGQLHAFYNVCRHRGSQLVPLPTNADQGSVRAEGCFRKSIRCPYHSWVYGLDGRLQRAPHIDDLPGANATNEFSLSRVAVDTWGGFIFLNLSQDEPTASLADQLSEIPQRLHRYPLAELVIGKRIVYTVEANWKVVLENYNECYHCAGVHPELCRIVPAFREGGGANLDWEQGIPHRDGAYTFTFDGTTNRAPFPGLSEAERTRHHGELAYPNLMISLSADHVAAFILVPAQAGITRIICDFLFHPAEVDKADFDPGDAVEFWDLINRQDWVICENVQRGMSSRAFQRGYYAPMEDLSLDIRRYIERSLGRPDQK
jgi:Rieske 2Fe-2S family protein